MGMPALNLARENPMEERMARLEAHVEHLQIDVSEIKGDIRRLDAKIDDKIDGLKDSITSAKLWAFALYLALAATLLAVLARGFKWI